MIAPLLLALLVGCQPIIIPPTQSAAGASAGTATTATNTLTTTTTVSDTAPVSAPVAVDDSSTVSTTTAVSVTTVSTVTLADSPTTTSAVVNTEPTLTVVVASLRIRSGPGTDYAVLGAAAQGEQYGITGQAYGCQWYQVVHPQLGAVWMSGGPAYVTTNTGCDTIAEAAIPTAPTAVPAPAIATATPVPAQEQQASNPAPTTPPAPPVDDPFPPDQGCLLLQNQLGPELTFTFTRTSDNWSDIVKVTSDQDVPYCLLPGYYRVTIDAPPPWSSINRDLDIKAGDRAYFPIRPVE